MTIAFISDIHLHPDNVALFNKFYVFLERAPVQFEALYILGDFFDAWSGDDAMGAREIALADKLHELASKMPIYYMHGNRDFLLGSSFIKRAGFRLLADPTLIHLPGLSVLLAHGDAYCSKDLSHQAFRRVTRHVLFQQWFLKLPKVLRQRMVSKVKKISVEKHYDPIKMDVDIESCVADMIKHHTRTLIHGHTHKPGLSTYNTSAGDYKRYVLSDWDDMPTILCYDKPIGLYFNQPVL